MKNKNAFIESILKEIELRKDELGPESIDTIYFGGGTPTVLEIKEINRIVNSVLSNFKTIENPEITIEANPDDLDKSIIKIYRKILIELVLEYNLFTTRI